MSVDTLSQPCEAAREVVAEDRVGRWVALLDEAEALLAAAVTDPDESTARRLHRAASQTFDTLSASEHEMTPDARRGARAYVWRRDHAEGHATDEPLPDEAVQQWWEQCLCRRCHAARVLGRPVGDAPSALSPSSAISAAPSTAAATPVPWTPPTPQATQITPTRRTRAVQATLFPAASRQRRQRRHQTQWTGS